MFTIRAELLSSHARRKMAVGLLLLVCAGAVLCSAQAQDPYSQLPENYKKGVDLVIEQLNTHAVVQHHFRFLRSLEKSDTEVNLDSEFMILLTVLLAVRGMKNFCVYLCSLCFPCEDLASVNIKGNDSKAEFGMLTLPSGNSSSYLFSHMLRVKYNSSVPVSIRLLVLLKPLIKCVFVGMYNLRKDNRKENHPSIQKAGRDNNLPRNHVT